MSKTANSAHACGFLLRCSLRHNLSLGHRVRVVLATVEKRKERFIGCPEILELKLELDYT